MHHLRRAIVRKIGGIAALCAILLLSLAPVASQALEHARIDALLASVCASVAPTAHSDQPASAHRTNHDRLAHLQACAYCDFIAHAPTPPAAPSSPGILQAAREPFTTLVSADAPFSARLRTAQPRAPPAAL
ncbi:DUF2946 family protein [Caballeronia sp. LZ035]|uniref:DUF2946 family protein n=1 Tax=Caballeronia sp. LZ035 TaxID=3038568 RepID=UPI0028677B3E|nr:DUF2946 family protein [Caballeronia sp. LZ035]MDR5756888.1 DUF2946 family protein [Caballeronia sp. LZ035]